MMKTIMKILTHTSIFAFWFYLCVLYWGPLMTEASYWILDLGGRMTMLLLGWSPSLVSYLAGTDLVNRKASYCYITAHWVVYLVLFWLLSANPWVGQDYLYILTFVATITGVNILLYEWGRKCHNDSSRTS